MLSIPSKPRSLGLLALLLGSCSAEPRAELARSNTSPVLVTAPPAASAIAERPGVITPYPPGAWRLANGFELERSVLWVSQILIRHADVRNQVAFNLAAWFSVPPPATRTREQALEQAQQIQAQLARDPSRFAELAHQYSEDLPHRDEGGSLGGIAAAQLDSWPQVLDALGALRAGEASRVVETRYGFHILLRSAPPPAEVVSGAHIVIGHESAHWLALFARNRLPERSREAARTLADELYRQARAEPARFRELVDKYSEHRDALVGGDLGAWSTREPSAFALRVQRLRQLAVAEVGAPIETHLGFEIIQRSAPRPRARYRARVVGFPTMDLAPRDVPIWEAGARDRAFANASALARELSADPARITALGDQVSFMQWEEGRGVPGLSLAFQTLRPGEITNVPVDSEWGWLIAQRLEPEPEEPTAYATELPAPTQPDLAQFAVALSPEGTQAFLRGVAAETARELALDERLGAQLRQLHEVAAPRDDMDHAEGRLAVLQQVVDGSRELLGPERFSRYRSSLDRDVAGAILAAAAHQQGQLGL